MDNYFDFDQAAIPHFDLDSDISSIIGDTNQSESNECFEALFLDKSASLPTDRQQDTVVLKLINDREIEAIRWRDDPTVELPMFKAKTPCALCARMGMDCYLASRGMLITGCTACISLYRECSFTYPQMPQGYVATFAGIAEDEQVCHGPITERKQALNSAATDPRGRKSGARFHRDAIKILKTWLSEHTDHPYPNERERDELKQLTGLKRSQINNWLANARRRGKVRPSSGLPSPILGAVDIPTQNVLKEGYQNLGPMDRWKCSPPEHEPASMSAIAKAVTITEIAKTPSSRNQSTTSLHRSRASSRKASSEDDSSNLSVMFQPPSVSSLETRESSNSTFSLASSRSYRSRQSLASSQDRRRRRRAPLLHQRSDSLTSPQHTTGAKASRHKQANGGKDRIFQCTFCTDTFPSKYDWQRHEKSLHLALERWTCCPMGANRIDSTTGLKQCVFCHELSPTQSHLEKHNFQTCHEKTVAERTFYRKDHLRQHLRLMHGVKYDPHMDTWKSTTFEVKSRCGFCPSLFSTWQARADHLAAHFRNGCDMKDWGGGWGFEAFVERLVENAIPPYLIGYERGTMNPYRAREVKKSSASNSDSPAGASTRLNAGAGVTATGATSSGQTSTENSAESSGIDWSCCERSEVDQLTKDGNCWHRLEEELIRYVLEKKSQGIIPSDKQIQDQARLVVYGDPDPWDWTMADNDTWLSAFKVEHGLIDDVQPEFDNTRSVPVAAPYVIKGGLKNTMKKTSSSSTPALDESYGRATTTQSLPGMRPRTCLVASSEQSLQGSSSHEETPITPVDDIFNMSAMQLEPVDGQHMDMDMDMDGVDFDQLNMNVFGEMDFEQEFSLSQTGSLPVTSMMDIGPQFNYAPVTTGAMMDFGLDVTTNIGQQKLLPVPTNPFTSIEDEPEMSLEAFDQLTGYTTSFR